MGSKWTIRLSSDRILTRPYPAGTFYFKARFKGCKRKVGRKDTMVPRVRYFPRICFAHLTCFLFLCLSFSCMSLCLCFCLSIGFSWRITDETQHFLTLYDREQLYLPGKISMNKVMTFGVILGTKVQTRRGGMLLKKRHVPQPYIEKMRNMSGRSSTLERVLLRALSRGLRTVNTWFVRLFALSQGFV